MAIQQKPKQRKIKGLMDIVFCIDATESMSPCIEQLKQNLKYFIDSFNVSTVSQQIVPDWRARVVYFRDLNVDKDALKKDFPFVKDEEAFKKQIDAIEATGGGDEPESILDALYVAITESDWREKVLHAVIAFTDAPPLPELHPSTVEPGQDRSINTVVNAFASDKYSRLWVYAPRDKIYEDLEAIPRSQIIYVDEGGSAHQGLANLDFKQLLQDLGKTLSVSASK